MTTLVGIYARISLDRKEGEGVARQVADCRALAKELGWEVVEEYVDNDISAFSGKARPEYRLMLRALEDGRIGAILAYHTDRLYRQRKDLAEFVDVVKATKAQVRTVKAGEVDLSTASGRLIAAQLGAIGIYESERMGERVARSKRERALQGRPPGGGLRAFGYEPDKVTVRPDEADLYRAAARRVCEGASLWSIAEDWNTEGVTTTAGNPWEITSIRRILLSPRYAGVRTYRGEEIGPAVWPGLVDRRTHDQVVAMIAGRRRVWKRRSFWLLSGLIACPKCGRVLYGSTRGTYRAYACAPGPGTSRGCGGTSVSAEACDLRVIETIDEWLTDLEPAQGWIGRDSPPDVAAEVDAIRATRKELTRRWAAGSLDLDEYDDARSTLDARLADLDQPSVPHASVGLDVIRAAWADARPESRRVVVEAMVQCPMPLSPNRLPDPADRLTVRLRT